MNGVPADATAVVLNATVTGASTASHLTLWPAGVARPMASNLNWSHGWTVANAVTVKLGGSGKVSVYNAQGSVDVVLDVVGYYRAGVGAGFAAMTPRRVLDSRSDGPRVGAYDTPWAAGTTRDVQLGGVAGIPADATAVVVNATVTNTTAPSFLTVWPKGQPRPLASSCNWEPGWSIPNAVTVKLGAGGAISVYNNAGRTDVVLDVVGFFQGGAGRAFQPISPARIQDSRPGAVVGPYDTPWSGGVMRDVVVTTGKIPSYARGGRAQCHGHERDGRFAPHRVAHRPGAAAGVEPQLDAGLDDRQRRDWFGRHGRQDQCRQQHGLGRRHRRRRRMVRLTAVNPAG